MRTAFAAVDDRIHVHAAFDMHDLGDLAMAAGLAEPVLDVDRLEVTYADVAGLVRDLRAAGAINVAGGRRRSFDGPAALAPVRGAVWPRPDGRLAVTVELILGQAWGRGPRSGRGEVRVPIDRIRRRLGSQLGANRVAIPGSGLGSARIRAARRRQAAASHNNCRTHDYQDPCFRPRPGSARFEHRRPRLV